MVKLQVNNSSWCREMEYLQCERGSLGLHLKEGEQTTDSSGGLEKQNASFTKFMVA
jgi:hypothetical protein